jgi:hypothetical protein
VNASKRLSGRVEVSDDGDRNSLSTIDVRRSRGGFGEIADPFHKLIAAGETEPAALHVKKIVP